MTKEVLSLKTLHGGALIRSVTPDFMSNPGSMVNAENQGPMAFRRWLEAKTLRSWV